MMAGARWLTAFQYWVVMVLVVKSAYGRLKALSNGIFSKAAKTWNPGKNNNNKKTVLSLKHISALWWMAFAMGQNNKE